MCIIIMNIVIIKKKLNNFKRKIMRCFHKIYLKLVFIPRPIKYTIAIFFVSTWWILMTTPVPWRLFVLMGVWIFFPSMQYKYIGRHFKPATIKNIEKTHSVSIKNILKK